MLWNSPISERKFDSIADSLELSAQQRVIDVGCGAGEMLIRLVERCGVQALGVDASEAAIRRAKSQAAGRVPDAKAQWIVADAKSWQAEAESFDLAICIGSTHAFGLGAGAFGRAIENLVPIVRPGGLLLLGEGFLKAPACAEYRAVLGEYPPDGMSHFENVATARNLGLAPLSAWVSNEDEWDEFEWGHQRLAEQAVVDSPGDSEARQKLERRRNWIDAYLRWGRDTLGFGVYLLQKPRR